MQCGISGFSSRAGEKFLSVMKYDQFAPSPLILWVGFLEWWWIIFSSVIYYEQVVAWVKSLDNRHGLLDPDHLNNDAATVQNRLAIIGGIDAKPNALPLNAINLKS